MSCFMGYNPLVAKEVKVTTWIKEFDGDSPVYPSFPNDGDCFVVFATDEDALTHNALSKKTYTNGDWADAEGGGGGGDYPTVTVTIDAEKLYCGLSFGGDYGVDALYDNGTYYEYSYSFTEEQLASGTTADFLMIKESFILYPNADFSLPNAVSITGSATYDNETHNITVTGDCSIHLIGFDE